MALLTIPVVIWSHEVQMWLGYTAPAFPGSDWIAPLLGTVVFLYGGPVFLVGAGTELADRQRGMMTPHQPRHRGRLRGVVGGARWPWSATA